MPDLQAFHEQVKRGDLDAVKASLATDPELLNAVNASGQNAFLLSKYYGKQLIADYLLSLHPELDLFGSCVAGLQDAVLGDVDRNRSLVRKHNPDGWSPLHLAAFFNHTELVKGLMNRGADANIQSTNAMLNTPLHAAVAGRAIGPARVLLERGAQVDARQTGGWTALHGAAQQGNREMVELLIANGADPAAQAENNQTPLDLALLQGRAEVAELLEQLGAKPH